MQTSTEIEVKFPVSSLAGVRVTLQDKGAHILAPRCLERNWRFDTSGGELTRSGRVLRVRQDRAATLTYKERTGRSLTRREIELPISSSNQAVNLLEALGYQIVLVYEKFREVFQLEDVEIMLDEVPFGCFVEVEGPDIASLKHAALRLGLAWEAGIDLSYAEIFESLKEAAGLGIQHMTFFDFEGYELDAIPTLGLRDALAEAGTRIE